MHSGLKAPLVYCNLVSTVSLEELKIWVYYASYFKSLTTQSFISINQHYLYNELKLAVK